MIPIPRTFNSADGLVKLDDLSGVIFSSESFAHRFEISRVDGYGYEGTISARFLRADGVTVYVEGSASADVAAVELPPECYAVPGPFLLTIFDIIADVNQAICIYAGRGTVLASESSQTTASSDVLNGIEAQIRAIMEYCFADSNSLAELMARYAVNISNMEGELAGFLTQSNEIMDALADSGISILSAPNMLDPHAFYYTTTVQVDGVDTTVERVYGQTNRCAVYGKAYMKNATNSYGTDNTDPDEISEAVTTLSPTITDGDGSFYRKGVAFTVTNPPANGYMNADILYYLYGNHGEGTVPVSESGNHDLDLKVGHVYTMSCWARVTSGETMMLEFMYSPVPYWMPSEEDHRGQRLRLAARGVAVHLQPDRESVQRLHGLHGRERKLQHDAGRDIHHRRHAAAGAVDEDRGLRRLPQVRRNGRAVRLPAGRGQQLRQEPLRRYRGGHRRRPLQHRPGRERRDPCSTNYAAGALVMWKGKLYKTSAAVATGATWAVGTNLTATTLAAELAALAQ